MGARVRIGSSGRILVAFGSFLVGSSAGGCGGYGGGSAEDVGADSRDGCHGPEWPGDARGSREVTPHRVTELECSPGAPEVCNLFDDDCDGQTDEGMFCSPVGDRADEWMADRPYLGPPVPWVAAPDDLWLPAQRSHVVHWDGTRYREFDVGISVLLTDLWGSARDDIWAVGRGGAAVHWDGERWSLVETGYARDLEAVWGSGPADVWAVGDDGLALRWDGATWTELSPGCTATLVDVGGSGSADAWAIGEHGMRVHWNGVQWGRVEHCERCELRRTLAFAPNDVWLSGAYSWSSLGWVNHWDGTEWHRAVDSASGEALTGILWGSGSNDVYGTDADGLTRRWDGTAWSGIAVPAWMGPWAGDVPVAMGGTGPEDLWVVAARYLYVWSVSVELMHWDGTQWLRPGGVPGADLGGISGVPGGPVWVAGWPVVQASEGNPQGLGGIWRRTAEDWTPVVATTRVEMRDVWAASDREAWAVGVNTILHWDGESWTATDTSEWDAEFIGVHGTAPDDVWAVGVHRATPLPHVLIVHWNGIEWQTPDLDIHETLRDVWAAGPDEVWAVGGGRDIRDHGVVLHWDGTAWHEWPAIWDGTISAVHGFAADDVWAVDWAGGVLHWDGAEWTRTILPDATALNDVWGPSPDRIWVVGDSGFVARREGGAWIEEPRAEGHLRALWGPSADEVYAVTLDGRILLRRE